jgi:DNA replicative helicase MCM subunit Mcm2 (Cdc46/Mcm family)
MSERTAEEDVEIRRGMEKIIVRDTILALQGPNRSEVAVADIIAVAVEAGISRERAEEILELMEDLKVVFSPSYGNVKFVE